MSTRTIANAAGAWTVTSIRPDGTKTVSSITKGGLERVDSYQNTGSTVIASTGSVRDPLGRQISTADSRTAATLYSAHTPAGQARTVTQPGARITSFTFDVMGRRLTMDAPDSSLSSNVGGTTSTNITRTSYYPTGQIQAQWGAQTNAAFYLYDEQNRMVNLRTYRALAVGVEPLVGTTGFDLTTWNYDSNRGFLLSKRDASNLGANYTYTNAGRLRTRQWARGLWTRYEYHAASGVLTAIRHFGVGTPAGTVLTAASGNDAATPDSDFTFDLHGRAATATTFTGVAPNRIEFTRNQSHYTANFTLDKEDIMVDPDGTGPIPALTRTLDRREDTLFRSTGWDLKNGAAIEHANTYTYKPTDGRLDTVTGSASTFTYGYTPNSANLIGNVAGPAHTVTNTWLPDRDGLDLKQNQVGTTNLSTYDYGVNAISQRESVATSGTAFGASSTTGWGYDELGQVVSADHPTAAKDFGYSYDQMGSRQRSSRNTFDPATATGTNLAVYRSTTTAGSSPGGNGLNHYGRLELYGASAENNTYDADGNQLNGRYATSSQTPGTRTWDGENRLVTAVVNTGYVSTSLYTYDAYHRRVAKRVSVYTYNTIGFTLYDGWNPIADYDRSNGTTTLQSTYTWGKDVSGSLQGAGGVGGLLAVQRHAPATSPGTYYPTYDGNGNISEYLTTTGAIAAHYEYGPFGEALTTTGPQASLFSHRFSTKPQDAETGYYYYGYRLYDPLSGRWPNRDPIGLRGSKNLYGMVGNNVVNRVDRFGLIEYDFDESACTLNVKVKWKLTFGHYDSDEGKFHRGDGWAEDEKQKWKAEAESAVEGYYSKLKKKCKPNEKCCPCPKGVDVKFELEFVDSDADMDVKVSDSPWHRGSRMGPTSGNLEEDDTQPTNTGYGNQQTTIVHEMGHGLGLDHPGHDSNPPETPDSPEDYDADKKSLMGRGMELRPKDQDKAFCSKIKPSVKTEKPCVYSAK